MSPKLNCNQNDQIWPLHNWICQLKNRRSTQIALVEAFLSVAYRYINIIALGHSYIAYLLIEPNLPSRYRIGKKIANGAFGQLRLVKDLKTGEVRKNTFSFYSQATRLVFTFLLSFQFPFFLLSFIYFSPDPDPIPDV